MTRRLFNILLNPYFQALVVAGLVLLLIPLNINKYYTKQVKNMVGFDQNQTIFFDLDHDGNSEKVQTFYNVAGNVGIAIYTDRVTIGQWNFKGIYQVDSPRIMFGDYDSDNSSEIYIFTLVNDSVMLHVMEYSANPVFLVQDRFIVQVGKNLMNPDHKILPVKVTDMNDDQFGDLVFGINSGFSRQPRTVFIYNLVKDSLVRSPESGAYIGFINMYDLNGDKEEEIIISTYAASNYNQDPVVFSDTSCWMIALDHNLNYIFPPVEFPGATGSLELSVISSNIGIPLVIGRYAVGSQNRHTSKIFLANLNGSIVKEREFKEGDDYFAMGLLLEPLTNDVHSTVGVKDNDGFYRIDADLNIEPLKKVKFSKRLPETIDIDQDGHMEVIVLAPSLENHVILRNDLSYPVNLDFPEQKSAPVFSVKLEKHHPPMLSVQGDQNWKLYNYGINPVYRFRFLIWLGIYLITLGFILIIRKLYSYQLKKNYEIDKKITTLQLSSVKAQMEPHFIMNTINTIGSSIYRQKPDEAYNLLLKFSFMVRSMLMSSDKLTRSLKEELDFVRNYLELEKSRFSEVFDYIIKVDDDVDQEAVIPKMIIQLHTENALKHGLLPKKTGGRLDISVTKNNNDIVIMITDNGIGRNMASKNISQSTGKGMKILGQFFETYNKYNKNKLRQEITDLIDDNKSPSGTAVKIYVPIDFNAGIF